MKIYVSVLNYLSTYSCSGIICVESFVEHLNPFGINDKFRHPNAAGTALITAEVLITQWHYGVYSVIV
jgi:hypothetical protein